MHHEFMRTLSLLCFVFLVPFQAWAEDVEFAKLFSNMGVTGTIVISPLNEGKTFVHDDLRASRRFSAASTFKILNTLVSLEENVISVNDTLKWDGISREIPEWNRDQSLESAFRSSCVWCFQELARRVGTAKYRHHLAASAYGELHEPFTETTFWLDGSLKISAVEQVEFLKKVYRRSLPFNDSSYNSLRQFMLVEQNSEYALRAKTGWATKANPPIGWYVGYVETRKGTWFFAMNMDTPDQSALPLRQKIARETLRAKGIIE
ncbi:MAG TPA: class D beta-lactamase [Methylophilaceae bacterium]|nr:class D beta-lactamase [Methylophilaceae bacterium]